MSCSDNECPENKECFVPSCYGASCRSVQPICLTVLNAIEFSVDVVEENDGGLEILEVEYNFVSPADLRLVKK